MRPVTTGCETADGTLYRVRVGNLPNEDAAQKLADKLKSEGRSGAVVVRIDDEK